MYMQNEMRSSRHGRKFKYDILEKMLKHLSDCQHNTSLSQGHQQDGTERDGSDTTERRDAICLDFRRSPKTVCPDLIPSRLRCLGRSWVFCQLVFQRMVNISVSRILETPGHSFLHIQYPILLWRGSSSNLCWQARPPLAYGQGQGYKLEWAANLDAL